MSGEELSATVTREESGPIVRLAGTMNRGAKETLENVYEQAKESPGEIRFDFSEVDYINSTGIAVIVGVLAMAKADRRSIGAIGLSDHYREVFEITRLADFIHIYESTTAGS